MGQKPSSDGSSNQKSKQLPKEEKHNLELKVDPDFTFKYNFENHEDKETRLLVEAAQKKEADKGHQWNAQYTFPETNELVKFSNHVYQSYAGKIDIKLDTHWKLLYSAKGQKVLFKSFDGLYGELYFNTKNNYLQLVIKGTSNIGDLWSDYKNILRNKKGGILDSAFTFGEEVRKLINNFTCKPMLLITGHSLGGFLAQLITYTITYCYVDIDGEVRSREEPTDDFGIYTVVFDSPAIYDHISSIDARDPIKSERFLLPIINFVADVNLVNTNSWIGKHLGIALAIKDFDCTGEASKRERADNLFSTHPLTNFENIVIDECHKVVNIPGRRTVKYKKNYIPFFFFLTKDFEMLYVYAYVARTSDELKDKLPEFVISKYRVIVMDESVSAEEFIPRAHHVLVQYKSELESGVFNGKKIIDDMVLYNMWRADMKGDSHIFCLDAKWKKTVEEWEDGKIIRGFESYEEIRFLGCLIHNTVSKCFHYDYEKFQTLENELKKSFLETTDVTILLIVKNGEPIINQETREARIVYLVRGTNNSEIVSLKPSALDKKSQKLLEDTELDFLGNKVSAIDIFGSELLNDLPIWSIVNLQNNETAPQDDNFYSNQAISKVGTDEKFDSATEFAMDLKSGQRKFVMISSDAGMGKSTALKQIALILQQELSSHWIVHLNLFEIQTELKELKHKKVTAKELVKKKVMKKFANKEMLEKIFDVKFCDKMVFLFDSLDEICPKHRETAKTLIEQLRKTGVLIVVTTRPHEGKNLRDAEIFKLEPLGSEALRLEFIKLKFKSLKKEQPAHPADWLKSIYGEIAYDFWSVPLFLYMAVAIDGSEAEINKGSVLQHKENIYREFLKKSIEDTLGDKLKYDKDATGTEKVYKEQITNYNKLIEILAISTIFNFGQVQEESVNIFTEDDNDCEVFINRFDVAKLDIHSNVISFVHRSYAEYLVARAFARQTLENGKKPFNNEQIKRILLDEDFDEIRGHFCGIIGYPPPSPA